MANVKFYTNNSLIVNSAITMVTGTSSSSFPVENLLNSQRLKLARPGSISSGDWVWNLDLVTSPYATFTHIAIVNHKNYTNDATGDVTLTVLADDTTAFDGPRATVLTATTFNAASEPIWLSAVTNNVTAARYWQFDFDNLDDTDYYMGCLFCMNSSDIFSPSVDPNLNTPMDVADGVIANENSNGSIGTVVTQRERREWSFMYETVSATDRDVLLNLFAKTKGRLRPFIWTDGTGYYYGRFSSSMRVVPIAAGLWNASSGLYNVSFTVKEEA